MKRIIIRIVILAAVFVACVFGFSFLMNRTETTTTRSMEEPSLPLLAIRYGNTTANRMPGYRQMVDEATLRDSLTVLPVDRNLTIELQPYGANVKGVTYTVTSLEDGSILENGRVKSFREENSYLTADFHIDNPIVMDREYMLRFDLDIGAADPVYYYTRLVQRNGDSLSYFFSYVEAFSNNCINKTLSDSMLAQLETRSEEVSSSLHYVNIHSSADQVTWGGLTPVIEKKAVPKILEYNENTVSMGLAFLVSSGSGDEKEYYSVDEFYRMRLRQDEVMLLDFERKVTQIFDGDRDVLSPAGLNVGITGKDIQYIDNGTADVLVFEQAGDVWEYDRKAAKTVRIFSFRTDGGFDERTENTDHGISLSSVSDNGDVTFLVYGYMAAGKHEGHLGIGLYRYSNEDNTTDELLYIPVTESYAELAQSLSRLAYVNIEDQCFLCYRDTIYGIKLSDMSTYTLQETMDWDSFVVSDSQILVAWNVKNDEGYTSAIKELNLDSGETTTIESGENDYMRSLGFMGEDIIYGLARVSDCYTDAMGNTHEPMYRICVRTPEGELVKDYQQDGVYITSVTRIDSLLQIERAVLEDGVFKKIADDRIMHYAPEADDYVSIKLTVDDIKGTEVLFVFSGSYPGDGLLDMNTRYLNQDTRSMRLPETKGASGRYHMYAKGGLADVYQNINQAIINADHEAGVVLDEKQRYAWERGNSPEKAMIETNKIPSGLLKATTDIGEFAKALPEGYEVWDLTGCPTDTIKYRLSRGFAVSAVFEGGNDVLITGYDQYNYWFYDNTTGEVYAVASDDAAAAFENQGNVFVSYGEV